MGRQSKGTWPLRHGRCPSFLTMDAQATYDAFLETIRHEFPSFELRSKRQSRSQRLIDRFLRLITFGGNSSYLTSVVTTIGETIYVPDGWEQWSALDRLLILRHQAVHLRQFRRYTLPGMALVYLLLPLPFVFAGGRAWLELEAYKETLTATWELCGSDAAHDPALQERIVSRFTGSDYGWMWVWPNPIRRALKSHLSDLERKTRT